MQIFTSLYTSAIDTTASYSLASYPLTHSKTTLSPYRCSFPRKSLFATLLAASYVSVSLSAWAQSSLPAPLPTASPAASQQLQTAERGAQVVNVYTNREPGLFANTLSDFTLKTGIKVNTIFSDKGLTERIIAEGASGPADLLITVDVGRLHEAVEKGLSQQLPASLLEGVVPLALQGEAMQWTSLSTRARVIYAAKERVQDTAMTYENLADPKWKGRVCLRSGHHPYNVALIAAMIAKKGELAAKNWLIGVKANLARKPSGGDRDVAKDIAAGVCDVGLGNSYYIGLMSTGSDENHKKWVQGTKVILPTFVGGGTHVNVSGAVLIKTAPNNANALKLLEHLLSAPTQAAFANANFEYPVRSGLSINPTVATLGTLTVDPLNLTQIAKARARASQLVDEVGFDQ